MTAHVLNTNPNQNDEVVDGCAHPHRAGAGMVAAP